MGWVRYPWLKLKAGQTLFVPCLDTDRMIDEGTRAARKAGIDVNAVPGIRDGKLGVLFTALNEPALGSSAPSESPTDESGQS